VMTEVPAATPETTPPETVATEVVAEVQGLEVAAVPDPVNVVVAPIHADVVPEMVGSALIVTVCVEEHPLLSVYVMTDVPAATPVTTPDETVATEVVAEVQGLEVAAVPDPVNVVVAPIQADAVPEMVGSALMVTVCVAEQPLLSVYVITEVPAATPETTPDETVATEVVAEVQGLEVAAVPDPVNVVVAPTQAEAVPVIVVAAGCVIVTEILEILPVLDFT